MKLKEKLKNWLFKEELDEIKNIHDRLCVDEENIAAIKSTYDECLRKMDRGYREIRDAVDLHDKSHTLLEDCRKLMNSICDVGTDIGFKDTDHSWAVICIHGKMDYVKFVDMSQRDIRSIADFLKNFEYSNRIIDSPLYYRRAFEDLILKW